jgi:5-methylcytosine-specific restriction endonuclease McrA
MSQHSSSGSAWQKLSKEVLAAYGRICWICQGDGADTVDHIIPKSKGGGDDWENLRPAHRSCNGRRGDDIVTRVNYTNPGWGVRLT